MIDLWVDDVWDFDVRDLNEFVDWFGCLGWRLGLVCVVVYDGLWGGVGGMVYWGEIVVVVCCLFVYVGNVVICVWVGNWMFIVNEFLWLFFCGCWCGYDGIGVLCFCYFIIVCYVVCV